jgi:hypothetical protein
MTSESEGTPLGGGWTTAGVVRVGDTVRRPRGTNGAFVEALLAHLERSGFDASPRFLGHDDRGRQMLTFVEGDVPSDCRSSVWTDEQLANSMALLRTFHDHTAGSALAGEAEVVCHHDYGPWNVVWRGGLPVAIIDFDNAAPGRRLDDLGYATWKHLNLGLIDIPASEQRRRLAVMTESYGTERDERLLAAISAAQARMQTLIETASHDHHREAALVQIRSEREWLARNGALLL